MRALWSVVVVFLVGASGIRPVSTGVVDHASLHAQQHLTHAQVVRHVAHARPLPLGVIASAADMRAPVRRLVLAASRTCEAGAARWVATRSSRGPPIG